MPQAINREFYQRGRMETAGRRLLEETASECDGTEATLWIVSSNGRMMEGALNHGRTPEIIERSAVPLADSVIGMVASSGIGICIGPEDPHHPGIDEATGTRTLAMVSAPVYLNGKLCGVLSTINPRRGDVFSAADLEKLHWKCYLMGLIIQDCLQNDLDR
jgi:GAF domain-containing protein